MSEVAGKNKKISVIIPNFNGRNFLATCLASLKRQAFDDFELVLVDNGSDDDSVFLVKKEFPKAIIYVFKDNVGFSRAVNRGIELSAGDYIFLLNNDTELADDCLENIVYFLDEHPEASFLALKMLYFSNRKLINGAGDMLSIYGLACQRGKGENDEGQYENISEVFGACAGAAVYRRELFSDIGSFDEDYFAYLEDIDFSFRAQLKGYKCFYLPSSVVYHVDGGTSRKIPNFSQFLITRNGLYLVYKNFPVFLFLILSPFLLVGQLRNVVSALKRGNPGIITRAYRDFFVNLSKLKKKRKIIQNERRISVFKILFILSKRYPFSFRRSLANIFLKNI
jgi:hypothetical protein